MHPTNQPGSPEKNCPPVGASNDERSAGGGTLYSWIPFFGAILGKTMGECVCITYHMLRIENHQPKQQQTKITSPWMYAGDQYEMLELLSPCGDFSGFFGVTTVGLGSFSASWYFCPKREEKETFLDIIYFWQWYSQWNIMEHNGTTWFHQSINNWCTYHKVSGNKQESQIRSI